MRAAGITEPYRCSAHGKAVFEHVDEYANDCTVTPYQLDDETGGCADCETYAVIGMHWDTCPQRGRFRPLTTDDWRRKAERLKARTDELEKRLDELLGRGGDPELATLGNIVAELQRLDETERGRTLRYLNHRYADSGATVVRGPGSAPPL
jgi:hypothetical protein